jgi:hypothetical protein
LFKHWLAGGAAALGGTNDRNKRLIGHLCDSPSLLGAYFLYVDATDPLNISSTPPKPPRTGKGGETSTFPDASAVAASRIERGALKKFINLFISVAQHDQCLECDTASRVVTQLLCNESAAETYAAARGRDVEADREGRPIGVYRVAQDGEPILGT